MVLPSMSARLRQAQAVARVVGLYVPLALTLVGLALMLIWLPRLPNPMASHWNGAGVADGFGSPWVSVVSFPLTMLIVTSLFFAQHLQRVPAMVKPGTPAWGAMNRLISAIVLGTVVLIFAMEIGTTVPQLDVADARTLGSITVSLVSAFGIAIVAGVIGYVVQPKLRIESLEDPDAVPPLDLADTEPAVWFGEVKPSRAYSWVVAAVIATMLGALLLVASARPFSLIPVIIMAVVCVVVTVLLLMCARFSVSIDDTGLRARSLIGWPVIRVPAGDVDHVTVGDINPFAEFGGWGLRWSPDGKKGIVMRAGEGIRITRKTGRGLVLTLDDAATAASVLSTVAARSQNTRVGNEPQEDEA